MQIHLQYNSKMFPKLLFIVVLLLLMSACDAFWLLLSALKFSSGCPAEGELRKTKGDGPQQPQLKIETCRKVIVT